MREPTGQHPFRNLLEGPARYPLHMRVRRRINLILQNQTTQFLLLFGVFLLISALVIQTIEGGVGTSRFASFFDSLWFTVVSITTVGYGDMYPTTTFGQAWAMLVMFLGIGLVAVITGSVASFLVERNRNRALGLVPMKRMSGHTIICGWKRDMRDILIGFLGANPGMTSADLVLISTRAPSEVSDLRRSRLLRDLNFVFGAHTDRNVLELGQVATAHRVAILADEQHAASPDEIDSKTVLSATAVEALNSVVYTFTELLQPHFTRYLEHARVEEVVYSRENERELIVAAALGDGLATMVTRLFRDGGKQLELAEIPRRMEGLPYAELAEMYGAHGLKLLGVLENTGNLHERKNERLRAAMQTSDYREAVRMLARAGELESNRPRFGMLSDPVPRNAKAIVLLPYQGALPTHIGHEAPGSDTPPQERGEQLAICGWKHNMAGLLENIVQAFARRQRRLEHITVVSRMPPAESQAVAAHAALGLVTLVDGEPTDPRVLRRSAIHLAERVIVLSTPAFTSDQESDARNVMVGIAINQVNPGAYKCVEIYNADFVEHLSLARVEEVILTRRYQQELLAHASAGTGASTAIRMLMDPLQGPLRVVSFPAAAASQSYGDYAEALRREGLDLIGVMEYAGNQNTRKRELLYQARIQAAIGEALERLNRLKSVSSNQPLLNPPAAYTPGPHARAIVLQTEPAAADDPIPEME